MAQFLGSVQGQRGEATRLGSKNSGLVVKANGWNSGVRVVAMNEDGQDVFYVYATGGSGYSGKSELIATVDNDGAHIHGGVLA
jgi:Na+-translocating ferredoxin:NAD+ oxidoreductase RnfG subunit